MVHFQSCISYCSKLKHKASFIVSCFFYIYLFLFICSGNRTHDLMLMLLREIPSLHFLIRDLGKNVKRAVYCGYILDRPSIAHSNGAGNMLLAVIQESKQGKGFSGI